MKNFILLVLSLFFMVNTASADNYEKLYIIGDAIDFDWVVPKFNTMEQVEDGIYTWRGFLINNSQNQRRFKFAVAEDQWHPSLTCPIDGGGHVVVNPGEETDLYLREDIPDHDYAFQVTTSGVYNITVDLNTYKMVCIKEKEWDDIYITGNATPFDWNMGNASTKMIRTGDYTYTWSGRLINDSETNARFKFLFGGDWHPSLTCRFRTGGGHLMTESGEEYDVYPNQNGKAGSDYAFQVSSTGDYTITLDLATMKMTCVKVDMEMNQLYIAGNATEAGWDLGKAIEMNRLKEGVFVWTGHLEGSEDMDNKCEFKFICSKSTWDIGFNALDPDTEVLNGGTYGLHYRFGGGVDDKFIVTTPGQYAITVDLNEMTMFVENAEITRSVEEDAYGTICLPMNATVENAIIYEVAGVDKKDKPSTLYLKETDNNEMLAGVPYIFKATEEGTVKFSYTGEDYAFEPKAANGLVGTYERVQVPQDADNYVLSVGYKWYLVDSEFYCGANRAYLDLTATTIYEEGSTNARAMNFNGNDGATGIAATEIENPIVDVYTIQGVKVRSQVKANEAKDGLLKGIYIINGKKEIVM